MRVLVAMDSSEQSWAAFDYAVQQFPEATLVCLRVIDPVRADFGPGLGEAGGATSEWLTDAEEQAEEMFATVEERAAEAGVAVETHSEIGRPTRTITEFADDCDHVVVGSHGREGVVRVLLGSVAETVVRRSPVPVTVVR